MPRWFRRSGQWSGKRPQSGLKARATRRKSIPESSTAALREQNPEFLFGSLEVTCGEAHFCHIGQVNLECGADYLTDLAAQDPGCVHILEVFVEVDLPRRVGRSFGPTDIGSSAVTLVVTRIPLRD